jgi:hypothetical protein
MFLRKILFIFLITLLVATPLVVILGNSPSPAFADIIDPDKCYENCDIGTTEKKNYKQFRENAFYEYIKDLYEWSLPLGAMIAFAIIIYAGILYTASQGNPEGIKTAKQWIYSALAGLLLLLFARIIFNIIGIGRI